MTACIEKLVEIASPRDTIHPSSTGRIALTHAELIPYTRAVGTMKLAKDFLGLAPVEDATTPIQPLAAYYVLGHALELALKAILIERGIREKKIKKLGHDLEKVLHRIPDELIAKLPSELPELIRLLAPMYRVKRLEYVITGFGQLPEYAPTLDVVARAVSTIASHVEAAVRARLTKEGKADQ